MHGIYYLKVRGGRPAVPTIPASNGGGFIGIFIMAFIAGTCQFGGLPSASSMALMPTNRAHASHRFVRSTRPSPYILYGAYYLKDRDTRPKVW